LNLDCKAFNLHACDHCISDGYMKIYVLEKSRLKQIMIVTINSSFRMAEKAKVSPNMQANP